MLAEAHLYAIVDLGYVSADNAVAAAHDLLEGGAGILQLRAKGFPKGLVAKLAVEILPLCRAAGVPFIVNDYADIAASIGADGVHIGQDDGTLAEARALFFSSQSPIPNPQSPILFGRSTHSLDQARAALAEGFDYIGFGPLFATPTKAGRPAIGLQDVAAMEREVGSRIPAFCIGGIKTSNLHEVLAAGARRVVVVSELLTATNIRVATRGLLKMANAERGVRNEREVRSGERGVRNE